MVGKTVLEVVYHGRVDDFASLPPGFRCRSCKPKSTLAATPDATSICSTYQLYPAATRNVLTGSRTQQQDAVRFKLSELHIER